MSARTGVQSRDPADTRASAGNRAIVIGAGAGGLSAAITLAARGVPVTLLEQHATPGGKMRRVEVAGRPLEAGPTVFTMRWIFDDLFASAGLAMEDFVPLSRAELLARHYWIGSEALDLFTDIERSAAAIEALAGGRDADNYRAFAARAQEVFETLDHSFMRRARPNPVALSWHRGVKGLPAMARTEPFQSLWRYLAGRFHDPRLRQLFARYATYCGSSPLRAPATLMLIAHAERAGVWQVAGGMHALAQGLARAAEQLGVETHYNTGVARIIEERGRTCGVELVDGHVLQAETVLFNGDSAELSRGLLVEPMRRATPPRTEPSLSAVTLCQVARLAGRPLAHHTVLFGQDYPAEFKAIFEARTVCDDPTVYLCAQDRDGSAQAATSDAGPERLFALINAPATILSPADLAGHVEQLTHTIARHGIELHDSQGTPVITGPDDFDRLFPATDGALYGRPTHGWMGSFKRPGARTRISGLYCCGGGVHPGAGVPMASMSGVLAAQAACADLGWTS